jgi:hypothetical protein
MGWQDLPCSTREVMRFAMRSITAAAGLLLALISALAAEPSEHWRCGPYDIKITSDSDYPHVVDEGFVVHKKGRDPKYQVNRARISDIEDNGCRYHSCPHGARAITVEAYTWNSSYEISAELLTIWRAAHGMDGVTRYTENVYGGKTGRLLRSEEHLCHKITFRP